MGKLKVPNPIRMKQGHSRQVFAMHQWYSDQEKRAEIIAKEDAILAQKQKSAV